MRRIRQLSPTKRLAALLILANGLREYLGKVCQNLSRRSRDRRKMCGPEKMILRRRRIQGTSRADEGPNGLRAGDSPATRLPETSSWPSKRAYNLEALLTLCSWRRRFRPGLCERRLCICSVIAAEIRI